MRRANPSKVTPLGRILFVPLGLAWFLFCVLGVIGAWINVWVLRIRDWWKGKTE
jgi:hypothetical protein